MKQIQKKSQIGRLMTEMLGVLAIIGVLSIAAVSGYRNAITRHKTNNLIEDVKLAGFLVMEGKFAKLPVEEEAFIADFTPKTKYEFLAFKESDTTFGIVATHVEENVCHETLTRKVDWLEEIRANGTDKACHDTDDNNISFFFNTALNDILTQERTCITSADCGDKMPYCCNGMCQMTTCACTTNDDCMGTGKFCWFGNSTCRISGDGECKKVADFTPQTKTMSDGKTWTRAGNPMNWWSAQNWCRAQGLTPTTRADIECKNISSTYCQSETLKSVQQGGWNESRYLWLEQNASSCNAYTVNLKNNRIDSTPKTNSRYSLCKE